MKSDQGQIDSAKLNLTYSRITAPISGTRRSAAGRSGQHRARHRSERPGRDHAAPADRRALHDSPRTVCQTVLQQVRSGDVSTSTPTTAI